MDVRDWLQERLLRVIGHSPQARRELLRRWPDKFDHPEAISDYETDFDQMVALCLEVEGQFGMEPFQAAPSPPKVVSDRPITNRALLRSLADEYEWQCGICGRKIPDVAWVEGVWQPLYLSLDHIVPLDQDGADEWDNWQPVHARCNSRKGNRLNYVDDEV